MSVSSRIMVVDDESDLVKIVEIALKKWGYQVDAFTDPYEALDHFKTNALNYFLVITDIRMPELSGLELASLMLEVRPEVKVVVMTAYEIGKQELKSKLPIAKHEDILHKPFPLTQVCNAVKKNLAK